MFTLRIGSLVAVLALVAVACAPKYTPEIATQRFVTEASVPNVLGLAADVLRANELSIVALTDTYVCGERQYREFYRPLEGWQTWLSRPAWRLVRVSALEEDGSTHVTVTPSPSFPQAALLRFPGKPRWLGDAEARRSWCEDPTGADTPLTEEQVSLCEELASMIKKGLGGHES